ncbi:hypothetical protein QC761_0040410 [Podospora bellae-mahoneyi]|uniref:Secreted protein n=1 Tax=Podospora bellae-mahoneyi TaxID=2093777 RepID=A0ABR0FR95_9PEZI|nr:hypothetical protein QC761_0040410 [Podospora bellae-mahoneyi]
MTLMTLMTWVIVLLFLGDEIGEVGVRLGMDRGNGQTRHSVALAPVQPRSDVGHVHRESFNFPPENPESSDRPTKH